MATTTSWQVPGPSSRYHKQEWASAAKHARFAPTPDTDVPRSMRQSARGSTQSTSLHRSQTAPMEHDDPFTPMRSPHLHNHLPNDSPFSDYFTDDARSTSHKGAYHLPAEEVQQLILRLNNLGAQMLRQRPSNEALDNIGEKLDELERTLGSMDRSPRIRRTMSDSGYVGEDTISPSVQTAPELDQFHLYTASHQPYIDNEAHFDESHDDHRERILRETQSVLERVTKTNAALHERFEEMRSLNDQHASQAEESVREAMLLRSENEALKADLGFDHSELLFLKLQCKALEIQAGEVYNDETPVEGEKRVELSGEIEQWKSAWEDVDARQSARRLKHRVVSTSPGEGVVHRREDGKEIGEQGDWKLDLSRKRSGRVQSITLRRFSDPQGLGGAKAADAEAGAEKAVESAKLNYTTHLQTLMEIAPHDSQHLSIVVLGASLQTEPVEAQQDNTGTQTDADITTPDIGAEDIISTSTLEMSSLITVHATEDIDTDVNEEVVDSANIRDRGEEAQVGGEVRDGASEIHQTEQLNGEQDGAEKEAAEVSSKQTAWRELMDSLAAFAGMSDD